MLIAQISWTQITQKHEERNKTGLVNWFKEKISGFYNKGKRKCFHEGSRIAYVAVLDGANRGVVFYKFNFGIMRKTFW